ncbi:MAG: amidase [Acidobacteria bacterium]|nr:MAG: amidase [Acidobacteriota bacterium]
MGDRPPDRPAPRAAFRSASAEITRRELLVRLSAAGLGGTMLAGAVDAAGEKTAVTAPMIRGCSWLIGQRYDDDEIALMLRGVGELLEDFAAIREIDLDNAVPPALRLQLAEEPPCPSAVPERAEPEVSREGPARPESAEDLAFLTIAELSGLVRRREVSASELTRLYLERLERFDPVLRCVITLTAELAMEQARRADEEIARGRIRGPLHGIPWGAKDLIAVPGYPTTWGARPFRDQYRPETATVAARLERAGAVLAAKTSVGALAWGDVWFGGQTRNPWNPEQGSSGSSAGSAAAVAAGLVGFALGTETWGSIVSPCSRCGATGLRPTFGRVSRHGVMALSWSMDKVGVIARSAEDCALVFSTIHGADGLDPSAVTASFRWPPVRDPRTLRIGFVPELFERDRAEGVADPKRAARLRAWAENDRSTLEVLRAAGIRLVEIELPRRYPIGPLALILTAEASAAFDELTRSGRDEEMVRQEEEAWPNVFRQGQLIPAVEYLRANRVRTLLMREMERALAGVDGYVCPSFVGDDLLLTNLTGHPAVVVPNGFAGGTPTSITFVGRLFGEENLLALARVYQEATAFHRRRPPLAARGTRAGDDR